MDKFNENHENLQNSFEKQKHKKIMNYGSCVKLSKRLKDDVLPETLSSLKIVLPGQKSSLTLDPLKQMVIITP